MTAKLFAALYVGLFVGMFILFYTNFPLAALHQKQEITDEEYELTKKKLLGLP